MSPFTKPPRLRRFRLRRTSYFTYISYSGLYLPVCRAPRDAGLQVFDVYRLSALCPQYYLKVVDRMTVLFRNSER